MNRKKIMLVLQEIHAKRQKKTFAPKTNLNIFSFFNRGLKHSDIWHIDIKRFA
jgi:hypothetical protein